MADFVLLNKLSSGNLVLLITLFKLSGRHAFGGCALFPMKPSMNITTQPFGHDAFFGCVFFLVGCRRLVPGLYARPNIPIVLHFHNSKG
jgi:hypothetical protein